MAMLQISSPLAPRHQAFGLRRDRRCHSFPWMAANCLQVLHRSGFLYDSSLLEDPTGESLSRGMAARVWPYTLQDGVAQNCEE